ncbi:MAG TPA: vWA domain-containing protein [Chthonomonadaceae bacterium]|nr:vWA domain-containing protein [Chthonomonadaceae bacterium]
MFDLELAWDRPYRSGPAPTQHVLRIRLLPQAEGGATSGMPLRLAIALDTSSSMQGEKLEQAKEACRAVILQMRPEDRFALAAYSTQVEPLLEGLPGGIGSLASVEHKIASIEAAGVTRTDLALDWLERTLPSEPGIARAGILITDGHPTDPRGAALEATDALVAQAARLGQAGMTLYTVGLGTAAHFNTAFLVDLSDRGHGAFLYADEPQTLEPLLRARLTTAQTLATDDLRLLLRPLLPGVTIKACCRLRPEHLPLDAPLPGEAPVLQAGAVQADVPTDLLVAVTLPPPDFGEPLGPREVLSVEVAGDETAASAASRAAITATTSYTEAQQVNAEVDRDRLQWEMNVYSQALHHTRDPRKTAQLLADIQYAASKTGQESVAQMAAQQLQDLKKTGMLDAHRATGLLTSTRSGGLQP